MNDENSQKNKNTKYNKGNRNYSNKREENAVNETSINNGGGSFNNKKQNNRKDFYNKNKGNRRIRVEETLEDIAADMLRIEKEIQLEIKEIISMRLGL